MKKLLSFLLVITIIVGAFSAISVSAETEDFNDLDSIGAEQKAEDKLKEYIYNNADTEANSLFTESDYIFADFGKFTDYEVCCAGFNIVEPWEPWARIGSYAFKLNTQMMDDPQLLGLYLVGDNQITRLEDAYANSIIDDADMDEIIKLIISKDEYKKYFYIYNITNVQVGLIGDYGIWYEGITTDCSEITENVEIGVSNITISDYNLLVYGYSSFVPSGSTKGLYVVDNDNNTTGFIDAYNNSLIGTADEIIEVLKASEFNNNGYWNITTEKSDNNTDSTDPAQPEPIPTVSEDTEPTVTEPEKTNEKSYKDFIYEVVDNKVKITKYNGSDKSVTIPNTIGKKAVTEIGKRAFSGNKKLQAVTIGKNVEVIGASAFADCANLSKVTFGKNVNTISRCAFSGCKKLKSIALPSKLTKLKDKVFLNTGLTTIKITKNIKSINQSALEIDSLKKITVAKSNKWFSSKAGVLYNKKMTKLIRCPISYSKTKLTVPKTVKTIAPQAFSQIKNVKKITLSA